ncbi:hypothetical protein BX600DRAFT_452901 [Xylariales sp. PMI_506]|nr:hypothetical protein BX600DRAFT_452901 [Xylariales sp. PMI_506]
MMTLFLLLLRLFFLIITRGVTGFVVSGYGSTGTSTGEPVTPLPSLPAVVAEVVVEQQVLAAEQRARSLDRRAGQHVGYTLGDVKPRVRYVIQPGVIRVGEAAPLSFAESRDILCQEEVPGGTASAAATTTTRAGRT